MSGPTKAELEARLKQFKQQQQRKREQSKTRREDRKQQGEKELRIYVPKEKLAACQIAVEQVVKGAGYPSVVDRAVTEAIPLAEMIRQTCMILKRAFGHRATEHTEKNQCVGKHAFNTF
ncbi:MAG: hypothetical protein H7842_08720 [Gammaproteobacteria bacterium SHHR-1]|uniref:hypothetical protein n=1 Tax=Magnetovirga frankeli TaxID=947516 RepID=UPI001292D796|nr:hypothetical protein D5125_13490 [gamma proteobacterium SS-5]